MSNLTNFESPVNTKPVTKKLLKTSNHLKFSGACDHKALGLMLKPQSDSEILMGTEMGGSGLT